MGFQNIEISHLDLKIAAGVIDAASEGLWADSKISNIPSIFNKNVLTEFHLVPQAANLTTARTNATANPTLIQDYSQDANAIRLTVVAGTDSSTFLATSEYGVYGESVRLRNWIHPTRVPLDTGLPSIGYGIRLFQGNPQYGGTEILTTTGLTGTGVEATPAWVFNYDQGILLISDDFKTTLTNPYILGFRYIGKTFADTLTQVDNQAELDAVEAAIGLNTNGTFQTLTGTRINSATSIGNALEILDAAITSTEGIFILDVAPTNLAGSGIVGDKVHPANTNKVLVSCTTDTTNVTVTVGINGGATQYAPTVTIGGVSATVTETATTRWFLATADIVIGTGTTRITAISNTGASTYVDITLAGAGPEILGVILGDYPGTQTSLKAGDSISVEIETELTAVEVTLLATGASSVTRVFPVTNGVATATLTINNSTGLKDFTFKARNAFGTYGGLYLSEEILLDQSVPTFSSISVNYPLDKNALNLGDSASVSCTVSDFTTIQYTAPDFTIDFPTTYVESKSLTNATPGYVDSGVNYTITAYKASNNTFASTSTLIKRASTPPTAYITIAPTGRLISSPTGVPYTVQIHSTQELSGTPSLVASAGSWAGSWTGSGKIWSRSLVIYDSTPRGSAYFSSLDIVNQALIAGTTITSGENYFIGGFTQKLLTFPPFSRVAAIGTSVVDQTKTSAQISGGATLTRYSDNNIHFNGYYIANSDGSYNPTGDYLGLSDSVFAGANTSGTLQVTLIETA